MSRVVCCVDDSDQSLAAARYAAQLAEALGHELVLVHVVSPTYAPGVSAAAAGRERLREAEVEGAEEVLARVADEAGLPPGVRRRAEIGSTAGRVIEVCEAEDAALVVLGSRGRGGLKAALLGSVSTEVAAHAPCPCVIVSHAAAERLGVDRRATD